MIISIPVSISTGIRNGRLGKTSAVTPIFRPVTLADSCSTGHVYLGPYRIFARSNVSTLTDC